MALRFGRRPPPPADAPPLPIQAAPGHLRHRLESRTRWITAAASPLLLSAFFQDPFGLATNLGGFALIAGGMVMTRQGLQAEAAYDARRVAKRPALPRKLFGGLLAGAGLAIGSAEPHALLGAGVVGVVGAALHWLSFGSDPMRDKGLEGVDSFQQGRVARIVAEAEGHLTAMQDAIARTGDPRLQDVVADFAAKARALYARIEENPAEVAAARRYLGVWLLGARDATMRFADLYAATGDRDARLAWLALMADLTTEFAARSARMMAGGRADMEIEMAVLRDRLAREGLAGQPATPRQLQDDRTTTLDALLRPTPERERR